ncbi:CVNH domain-containing protein [Cladorrhinum sp. PSN332]|nr:CVNH domain-containing protein [Cladorrhinum sp. PSN332]
MTNYNNQNSGQGEAASYYASAGQQQNNYGQQQQQQQDGPSGERGFLGAVGGAVAGGAGGHAIGGKTGHSKTSTIIGAIAGAVAGHKLQDGVSDWKDKRDEEKEKKEREEEEAKKREEEEKRRREDDERRKQDDEKRRKEDDERRKHEQNNRPQQQQHHNDNRGVSYAGNFSGSSRDVRLDAHGEFMLHASCARMDGSYQASSISLNNIIENSGGSFRWASGRPSGGNNNCDSNRPRQVTVQAGDTLRDIGGRIGVPWQDIARQNNLQNPDMIHPGQLLQIPQGGGGGNGGGSVGNFGSSARNVRLEDGKRLVGELLRDGQWVGASLALDERIGNDNGTLTYKN